MRSKSRKHIQKAIQHVALLTWISGLSALLLLFPTMGRTQNRAPADPALTATERQHVLNVVINNLRRYYFDGTVGKNAAQALRAHQAAGEYAGKTAPEIAALLTRHMRDVSGDMHLVVEYSRESIRIPRPQPSTEDFARRRRELEQMNCTIQKPEILPGNIGYIKFDFFPDLSTCSDRFAAAMRAVDRTDALVFDLRDNRGGMPDTVSFVASYLFDHPEYLVNPRDGTTENSWTRSPVANSHLAHKRVYVLTSATTASGAEEFCYNLKMLRRATLLGETTAGAAHSGAFHRIDAHFGMGIPEVKTINPYSKQDWEGIGVEPDVKVRAADALETAKKMAAGELPK